MKYISILLLLITLACDSDTNDITQEAILAIGETERFLDKIDITVQGVLDSRCPSDELILCVWEGEAIATIRARHENESNQFELVAPGLIPSDDQSNTGLDSIFYAGQIIILDAIEPYPETSSGIPDSLYRIHLRIR